MKFIRPFLLFGLISFIATGSVFAQAVGSVGGQVVDTVGAVITGATVTVVSATGVQKQSISNARGEFAVTGLVPGKYTVKAIAPQFGLYENTEVTIASGQRNELTVVLSVGEITENVEVSDNEQISTDPTNNADATVIKGADLEALPDDPDQLRAALMALVGGSAGPDGGQIYIDGFTGGQLPSKDQIREIRINSNPFSAEYDRVGSGRVEILTRPGSERWRGSVNANFNDESLNSRNPFALNRAPTQQRTFGGNFAGPIVRGRSSFSIDVQNRDVDNNTIINAQIIDPSFNIIGFREDVQVPTNNLRINPRFDYAINDRNTLIVRYSFSRNTRENQGISETSLPSRAFVSSGREHEFRITETMIINEKTINETRFEYSNNYNEQNGDNSMPTINVTNAFIGGGASIGLSFAQEKLWEVNNFTSTSLGRNMQHSIKFGGKFRHVSITDRSENNYAGTFLFPGAPEIRSPVACSPVGPDCVVVTPALSSIEQFRQNLTGSVGPRFNPTQFNITTGNPEIDISQFDGGLFLSDDWKIRPDLLLSLGVRYENQSNINSNFNFAPRVGFAWEPGAGGARRPRFVIRGGAGIFYNRFSENFTLQADRFNGVNQLSLLVSANDSDPVRRAAAIALLAQPVFTQTGVINVPTIDQILTALPQSNNIRGISPTLQTPYSIQAIFSIERALSTKFTLSSTFFSVRSLHQLRTRNINAPICLTPSNCVGAVRPDPTAGNINVYESSGTIRQNRLQTSLVGNISPRFTFRAFYNLGFSEGDTDGANSTPAYTYDLTGEFGRSSQDVRHSFFLFGNVTLPWNVSLSPIINISSGSPFNITRGVDANGDGFLNERPTFGQLLNRCNELGLKNSFCDITGNDPTSIVPRNYGQGPSSFTVSMRFSKNFGFGTSAAARAASGGGAGQNVMIGGGPGGGRGGMGRMGGGGFGGEGRKPYNLNIGVFVNNLFNTVNFNNPSGTLTNSRFGQSTSSRSGGFGPFGGGSSGPNRRIELNMRFSW